MQFCQFRMVFFSCLHGTNEILATAVMAGTVLLAHIFETQPIGFGLNYIEAFHGNAMFVCALP